METSYGFSRHLSSPTISSRRGSGSSRRLWPTPECGKPPYSRRSPLGLALRTGSTSSSRSEQGGRFVGPPLETEFVADLPDCGASGQRLLEREEHIVRARSCGADGSQRHGDRFLVAAVLPALQSVDLIPLRLEVDAEGLITAHFLGGESVNLPEEISSAIR